MRCQSLLRFSIGCAIVAVWAATAPAAVRLAALFGDNAVLQRGQPVPIWGRAAPGEEVTVAIAGQTLTTKAGDDKRWKVVLAPLDVGQPLEMVVQGSSGTKITLKNILVGEVWVCSGQSNMEMGIDVVNNAKEEIAAADYPQIRLFHVGRSMSPELAVDVTGDWVECSPQAIERDGWEGFSAAAYFFGRQLHKELNVPIGLIQSCWGGTPVEHWTPDNALRANPLTAHFAAGDATRLYNGMISPLIPYGIRGAIWYQGESNISQAYFYRTLFPAMIGAWRANWGQGDFPFGFAQIAPFNYQCDPTFCAELWEAQLMTLKGTPNTGMAVTTDIGDLNNIHPKNKQEVGRRLALWALAKVYGRDLVYSGPIYKSMAVEGNKIRLEFDHVGSGLAASDGKPLSLFTIAGENQKFVPAVAAIDGNSVVVSSDQVAQPVAVRFAWRQDAVPNLANKEGLPASPFRTDTWKGVTEP